MPEDLMGPDMRRYGSSSGCRSIAVFSPALVKETRLGDVELTSVKLTRPALNS